MVAVSSLQEEMLSLQTELDSVGIELCMFTARFTSEFVYREGLMCVCVRKKEREREREGERMKEGGRKKGGSGRRESERSWVVERKRTVFVSKLQVYIMM